MFILANMQERSTAVKYEVRIYTHNAPEALSTEDALVENALRLPQLIDNELSVDESVSVAPEDIPASVLFSGPGLRYMTRVRLAHDEEDGSGNLRAAGKFARNLTDALGGVMLIPGNPEPVISDRAEKYVIPQINSYTPMLMLACYFIPSRPVSDLAEELVASMEEILPSVLPELYGLSDTPEFSYAECGREHFVSFLRTASAPVWYAHSPVTHVLISDATRSMDSKGFRASRIALTLPEAMWEYSEWQSALQRLLCRLMELFGGFFGQIVPCSRLGVAAWWWQGIPRELGYSCAFGEPYKSLIPDCSGDKNISDKSALALFESGHMPLIPEELISEPHRRSGSASLRRSSFRPAKKNPLA